MAESRLRQGLEVTGVSNGADVTVEIAQVGDPVAQPFPDSCILQVATDTKVAAIHLIDSSFGRIAEHAGFFPATGHKPGVFKLRVQYGREIVDVTEKIILLDRDTQLTIKAPTLKSPVPIYGTAYTHEFHIDAAHALEVYPQTKAAQLGIMARFWTGREPTITDASRYPHPLQGLSLIAASGVVVAEASAFESVQPTQHADRGGDPVATWVADVEPGIYFLRQQLASGLILERTLVASADWRTDLFIRRDFKDIADTGGPDPPRLRRTGSVAILMARKSAQKTSDQQRDDEQVTIEAARLALKQGRQILDETLEALLCRKFENPIMGILGALLLIMETLDPEAPKRPNVSGG